MSDSAICAGESLNERALSFPDAATVGGVSLATAFATFSSAAESLERSYVSLGQEVCRLRKELQRERDLRQRREALAEISALLAHEIRNPLASLELFAGLLHGAGLPCPESEWVTQIQAGLRIVSAMVNNVLEFHARPALHLVPIEINEVLAAVAALLAPVAERSGMEWKMESAAHELWVLADRHRLEQVFLNLALNAFRHAASGRELRVQVSRSSDQVVIRFADRGPGIAPEVRGRLFQAGVSGADGGPGLGLAVVKQVMQEHNGTVQVFSTPEQGTCFDLALPLIGPARISA